MKMSDISPRAHHAIENQNKVRQCQRLITGLVVDDDEAMYGANRVEKDELLNELERLFQTTAIAIAEEIPKPV